jgi:competence protein ComGD
MQPALMNDKGFSLVEVMASLLLASIIAMTAVLPVKDIAAQMQSEYLLNQLQQDLHAMQLYAMKSGKEVNFRFYENGQYRAVSEGEVLMERVPRYPLAFRPLSLSLNQLQFNPNGNIRSFGQLRVEAAAKNYNLVFQIGRGRFYFLEIK